MPIQADSAVDPADFINKSQANATPSNDSGRVPKLESDGKLDDFFLRGAFEMPALDTINGATTPQAVFLGSDGLLRLSDIDNRVSNGFTGFVTSNVTGTSKPAQVGTAEHEITAATNSFTVNAGTNLVMVIIAYAGDNSSAASLPSSFTWNSQTLTNRHSGGNATTRIGVWTLEIGTLGSNTTANIVRSGGNGANTVAYDVIVYDNVDQTTPLADVDSAVGGGTTASVLIEPLTAATSRGVVLGYSRINTANVTTSGVTDINTGTNAELSHLLNDYDFTASVSSASSNVVVAGLVLNQAITNNAEVINRGVIGGFSGLTKGDKYFLSSTAGSLSTTGDGKEVGIAVSTTQIKLRESQPLVASDAITVTTTTGSQKVNCGFRPTKITLLASAMSTSYTCVMNAVWQDGAIVGWGVGGNTNNWSLNPRLYDGSSATDYLTFSITSVTEQGFTISWTESGSFSPSNGPGLVYIAEA